MRNVCIVAGNGGMVFGTEEIKKLKESFNTNPNVNEVFMIGDGEKSISL